MEHLSVTWCRKQQFESEGAVRARVHNSQLLAIVTAPEPLAADNVSGEWHRFEPVTSSTLMRWAYSNCRWIGHGLSINSSQARCVMESGTVYAYIMDACHVLEF